MIRWVQKKGCFAMNRKKDFLFRLLRFMIGQSVAAVGASLMIALNWGSDAYNILTQGLAMQLDLPHGTMSSIMQFVILVLCIPKGRKRIGLGTVICIFLVGTIVNTMIPVFAPVATASIPIRVFCMFLIPLMIGSGVALVQLADVGMSSNDLLPLLFFEMQHKFQFRTVRILYDAVQCVIGLFLGGIIGVSSVVSLVLTGPIIQATVGLLRKCGLHERNR